MRNILLILLFSFAAVTSSTAEENLPDWIIETYEFPNQTLSIEAPPAPKVNATEDEITAFIKKSHDVVSQYFEKKGLPIPKGSLLIYDPSSSTLAARIPGALKRGFNYAVRENRNTIERYLTIQNFIFEAPAETVRELANRASTTWDHTILLEEMQEAVSTGEATLRHTMRTEIRSGSRIKLAPSGQIHLPEELKLDSENRIRYTTSEEDIGTMFEVDPIIGDDGETIDINLSVEHELGNPLKRTIVFSQNGKTKYSATLKDTFLSKVTSQYTTKDGKPKLTGIWKPAHSIQENGEDILQMSFIACYVVESLPLSNRGLSDLMKLYGEKVVPLPKESPKVTAFFKQVPEGMILKKFDLPFIHIHPRDDEIADPFAPPSEKSISRRTHQNILEDAGITFPPGSFARLNLNSGNLEIANTPEQMELVEAYLEVIGPDPEKSVAITMHFVEGPGELIRQASDKTLRISDHTEVWDELKTNPGLIFLSTNWIEARSGNRAKIESGRHYQFPVSANQGNEKKEDEKLESSFAANFDSRLIGTILEIDPVIEADGQTIDLNFAAEHHYASPTTTSPAENKPNTVNLDAPSTRFHSAKIATQSTILSGSTRIVSIWQPEGLPKYDNADILQALVMKVDIVEMDDKKNSTSSSQ